MHELLIVQSSRYRSARNGICVRLHAFNAILRLFRRKILQSSQQFHNDNTFIQKSCILHRHRIVSLSITDTYILSEKIYDIDPQTSTHPPTCQHADIIELARNFWIYFQMC